MVISFSIADAIAVEMLSTAEEQKIKIKKSIKKSFYQWFTTTQTNIRYQDVDQYISGGLNFFGLLKTDLKANVKTRQEIKEKFENNFKDLIDRINYYRQK